MIGKPQAAPKFYKKYLLERGFKKLIIKEFIILYFIEKESPIPKLPSDIIKLFAAEVISALAYLHGIGIIHKDLNSSFF